MRIAKVAGKPRFREVRSPGTSECEREAFAREGTDLDWETVKLHEGRENRESRC